MDFFARLSDYFMFIKYVKKNQNYIKFFIWKGSNMIREGKIIKYNSVASYINGGFN